MFIDKQNITIKAGNGGDGATSFIRYKGVANGGPDGGDGGRGGNVYFVGDARKTSLIDFEFKRKYSAQDGAKGGPKKCYGANGEDLVIAVPLGTVVKDRETGNIICDIFYDGEKKLVLSGGAGGKGNVKFCTSRRHAPHFSQKGVITEPKRITLELKTIADMGLLGFPMEEYETLSEFRARLSGSERDDLKGHIGFIPLYEAVLYSDREITEKDISSAESENHALRELVKKSSLRYRLMLMIREQ